jgi:hypothetical protein
MTIEHDETYKHHSESGTITCAAPGCDMKIRYSCDASTRPRYCKKHTAEYTARGQTDLRCKNPAIKRKSMQEVFDEHGVAK